VSPNNKRDSSKASDAKQRKEDLLNERPTHEQISRRAYQMYLEGGACPGNELDDWLRAERGWKGSRFTHEVGIAFRFLTAGKS
jgi:hypothetical protein